MKFTFKGLTLDNTFYSLEELVDFCLYEIISKDLPAWKKEVYGFIVEFISPTDSISQASSGTTGKAKYITLKKEEMIASANLTAEFFQLGPNQNALLCLPIKYIAGKMMVVRAFVSGMNLLLCEPKGIPDISSFKSIDFCAMVPMQVSNLLKGNANFENLKTLIIGGSEIDTSLKQKLQDLPTTVFETFGMTETCSHIALKKINGQEINNYFETLNRVKIQLDERKCLIIKAPFLKGKITTNDMVELIDDQHFKWLGRYDNMINSGGVKISPEILEQQIEGILQQKVVVASEPDELLGQKIVLVVESRNQMIEPNEILKILKSKLQKHLVPKKIQVVPEFPRNKNLKIDRNKLKSNTIIKSK